MGESLEKLEWWKPFSGGWEGIIWEKQIDDFERTGRRHISI